MRSRSAAAEPDRNALVANLQVLGLLGMQTCPADAAEQREAVERAFREIQAITERADAANARVGAMMCADLDALGVVNVVVPKNDGHANRLLLPPAPPPNGSV